MTVAPFDVLDAVGEVRRTLGMAIFQRIAGPDGAEVRRRLRTADDRWFPIGSPITRVHADASMFVGGLAALLLQSLHPLAMAGVDEHSGFRGDPWGRLARTSHFLAVTTFGSSADAEAEIAQVRAVHRRVRGRAVDGRPYAASDPHLLSWVHVAEVEMFLRAYQRHGAGRLTPAEADEYVAQAAVIARALGAVDVPTTTAEGQAALEAYRPELESTPAARSTARYLLANPPLPWTLRSLYLPLAGAAVALLPRWARWPLRLPWLPVSEATVLRLGGEAVTRTIRWALPAAVPRDAA
jgi:uncharacterized protein (DUF2236 family)